MERAPHPKVVRISSRFKNFFHQHQKPMADPGGELAELPCRALGVRAEALHERQQRVNAPAQALGGGAAEEGGT